MLRDRLQLMALALGILSASGCLGPNSRLPSGQPLPSRGLAQDKSGYFEIGAGIADDYPEESTTRRQIRKDLETLHDVGAKFYRVGIGWDSIEREPDRYDWGFGTI